MRRILLAALAVVVVVILASTAGLYWFFSGDGMRRALERQASSWLGQPVRIATARGQVFPRPGVALGMIEVGEPVQLTLASVELSTDLGALLNRRIEDARVMISDSLVQMPLPFGIPGANGNGQADSGADDGAAVQVVSIREIALRNVRITSRGHEILVSADSSLDGSRLTLREFTAESGGTLLQVEGEVELEPGVDATLRATANRLDVDELLALANAFTPQQRASGSRSRTAPAMQVSAQISAARATAAGVQATDFRTQMSLDGDRVKLSPLTFGLFGGRYEGTLTARLGEPLSATLESRLESLDVAQITAFGGSPDTIAGTLSGSGTFSARGGNMSTALADASGKGSVTIVDGTIQRLNLVRTVVLFFGRPAPETASATDDFERIDASFSLADRVFRADAFALQSRDADITGTARLALDTGRIDGRVQMTLSEELSAQAGTDLARFTREGSRIVLPANLGGTLEQPRITIDTSAAIQRGLRNEVERRLKGLLGR